MTTKSYELPLNPFSSDKFRVSPTTRSLVAEASDLGYAPGMIPGARLYNDACDWGMAVRSTRTGKVVRFVLHREERNPHEEALPFADIVAWHYRSIGLDRVVELVIFND
jgi:hypothetical protein